MELPRLEVNCFIFHFTIPGLQNETESESVESRYTTETTKAKQAAAGVGVLWALCKKSHLTKITDFNVTLQRVLSVLLILRVLWSNRSMTWIAFLQS